MFSFPQNKNRPRLLRAAGDW